jgi:5-formyltetrahydrofolate cyclo-ligase
MKRRLRKNFISRRDAIPPHIRRTKEAAIENRLFSLGRFNESSNILCYVSFRSEVSTYNILEDIITAGKKLILPRVDTRHRRLRLFHVKALDELSEGYMGIPEPPVRKASEVSLADVELIIIPGTGFDINGARLGYGGGYYDRLLSYESKQLAGIDHHITTVALAFEEQIGSNIPAEPHDIKVDIIITDKRKIRCPGS